MTTMSTRFASGSVLVVLGLGLIGLPTLWAKSGAPELQGFERLIAFLSLPLFLISYPILRFLFMRIASWRGLPHDSQEAGWHLLRVLFLAILLPVNIGVWCWITRPFDPYVMSGAVLVSAIVSMFTLPLVAASGRRIAVARGRSPGFVNPMRVAIGFGIAFSIAVELARRESGSFGELGWTAVIVRSVLAFAILTSISYFVVRLILPTREKIEAMRVAK